MIVRWATFYRQGRRMLAHGRRGNRREKARHYSQAALFGDGPEGERRGTCHGWAGAGVLPYPGRAARRKAGATNCCDSTTSGFIMPAQVKHQRRRRYSRASSPRAEWLTCQKGVTDCRLTTDGWPFGAATYNIFCGGPWVEGKNYKLWQEDRERKKKVENIMTS